MDPVLESLGLIAIRTIIVAKHGPLPQHYPILVARVIAIVYASMCHWTEVPSSTTAVSGMLLVFMKFPLLVTKK